MDAVARLTSIVVVAADSGPPLQTCVDSALASKAAVEVVLVDNASADGEVDAAASRHAADARLRVVRNGANLGFGPACNRGAQLAKGDVLLFLNPDCELPAGAVGALRSCLDADARLGLLGATVCDADGRPARGSRRRDPSLRRALATLTGLSRWESRWPALAGVEMPPAAEPGAPVEYVEAVSGACMMIRRQLFDRLAGFDEGYFLHVEDLDLCRRVRDAGFRVGVASAVRVRHASGSSSRHRPLFVARHKHRGMWRYFRKLDPAARNGLVRLCVRLGLWTHFAAAAPLQAIRTRRRRR